MKLLRTFIILSLISTAPLARAQDEPRAAWQITKFDITASAPPTERALTARALLTVRNVGRGAGSTLSLRINQTAEIKSVSVNNAAATFRSAEEAFKRLDRNLLTLQRFTITLPAPVAPNSSVNVAVDYRLPVAENSGLAAISQLGTQFLPDSYWYPAANAPYSLRGADVAPFTLSLSSTGSGELVFTAGATSGAASNQPPHVRPFFVSGTWDITHGTGEAHNVRVMLMKGAGADERKQAEALTGLAASARSFYAGLLGSAPESPINLITVTRGAGFSEGGTVLLDPAVFRRSKIDSGTAMLVAEAIARMWVGGVAPVRGEGRGVLREGLPRYLATLFLEKHFGRDVAEAEKIRQRIAYSSIAKFDGPLLQLTPLDGTYYNSASNKGAMIWRLIDRALGRDALMSVIRARLQAAATEPEGLTLASMREALVERGGGSLKTILDQQIDQPTDMDLLIGLPQSKGGQWAVALRNTGSLDASVTVGATTTSGERLTAQATVPARNFGEALFPTSARITRVEVDPDKLYPQVDYTNDTAPRDANQTGDALAEAAALFVRQSYAGAESSARTLLAGAPGMQEARILLARSLLGQNKMDEAEKEFRALIDERLPIPTALAWGNIGLAEISLRKGQAAEAAKRFNEAVRADAEYASTLAARLGRIKAEAAANAAPAVDESIRTFITQLDVAIKNGRKTELDAVILPGELGDFTRGIVGSQPEVWQTRVVRTELLDANRAAVDVSISARQLGRDVSGTAVLMMARAAGGGWKLAGIEFFEVR